MSTQRLILGGPGCGKTTRLLQIVESEIASGVRPEEIAYVAFTKAAAEVAKARAATAFHLDPKEDLPWFRTIHSMAYQQLGIQRDEVIDGEDWKAIGDMVGEKLTGHYEMGDVDGKIGERMLRIYDLARSTMMDLRQAWEMLGENSVDWWALRRLVAALQTYKDSTGKMDFTDMLISYNERGAGVPVRVAVIDEAQDLTPLQWRVVERAFAGAERVYIAGDDDQAIYAWAGADVARFLALTGEREVLKKSHRLSLPVFVSAGLILRHIQHRFAKDHHPANHPGSVRTHRVAEGIVFEELGTWLIIARNRYLLEEIESNIASRGLMYQTRRGSSVNADDVAGIIAWEQWRRGNPLEPPEVKAVMRAMGRKPGRMTAERTYWPKDFEIHHLPIWHEALHGISPARRVYYASILRAGQKLTATPQINLDTIHGVKGDEADHVVLFTDMSARTYDGYRKAPDNEHRVFYVGATRAKRNLHIIYPQTPYGYDF